MNEIFTIGYGGRKTEEFLGLLKQYNIDTLVDVRSQPYSKYQEDFSKRNLTRILQQSDIDYRFMGDLLGGRPDDPSCYRYSPQRKKDVLDPNRCETKKTYQTGIARLKQALYDGRRIVIMCSELEPKDCHRGYVLGSTLDGDDISVVHIGKHGEPMSQAQIPEMTYQDTLL